MKEEIQPDAQPSRESPGQDTDQPANDDALQRTLKQAFTVISAIVGLLAAVAVFAAPFAKTGPGLISISLAALTIIALAAAVVSALYIYRDKRITVRVGTIAAATLILVAGANAAYLVQRYLSHQPPASLAAGRSRSTPPSGRSGSSLSPTPSATRTVSSSPGPNSYAEFAGADIHTWTDYSDAGGKPGPDVAPRTRVEVSCRIPGLRVSDGDTWWYRIASPPWDNRFYASADPFYNNGKTSGSLIDTPRVDGMVPLC
jgi:hypothetical protein